VEKFNDWAVSERCEHCGMSWSPEDALSLASLEEARRMGNWVIGVKAVNFSSEHRLSRAERSLELKG